MKHVLVARLSSLGDIVLTQPVLNAIHQQGDHVTLMVQAAYQGLAHLLPGVDHVLLSDQKSRPTYDCLIDLHGTARSARALRTIKAENKVCYPKYSLARRLLVKPFGQPVFWNKWSSLKPPQSVIDWYCQAAGQAGYQVEDRLPRLNMDVLNRDLLLQQVQKLGVHLDQPMAILAPGAKWATKQWPANHFSDLARQLDKQHDQVILIGHQSEQDLSQKIMADAPSSVLSLIGQTTIEQMILLLAMSKIVITNDSGPMHLGLAAGAKVVALFGPTINAFGFMPDQERCQVVKVDLPCQPCSIHGSKHCPLKHHDCMENLSVAQVMQAINKLKG